MADYIVGVDPGQKGGLVCLDIGTGALVKWLRMPLAGKEVDGTEIVRFLSTCDTVKGPLSVCGVGIEIQGCRPEQSAQSGMTTGDNFGVIKGVCMGLLMPRYMVRPQAWMRVMLKGKSKKLTTKQRAFQTAKELWPAETWLANKQCRTPHDGAIDAALIAEFCRKKYWGILA